MYRPWPVPAALARDVQTIAAYDEVSATPRRRRELPHGGVTLILGLEPTLVVDGDPACPAAFVAGMADRAATTEFVGRQRGVQVDLHPLGALRLLGRPGAELAGCVVGVDALGPALAALPDRLRDDDTWPARLTRVVTVLEALRDRASLRPDPEVARAWDLLARSDGRLPVAALAAEVGWSRRHLLTRFSDQIGLPPTTARRVLRLHRATTLLVPGRGPGRRPAGERVADAAAAAGYADHAHLVRDFRDLVGRTPSAWLAEEFPDVQAAAVTGS